ncbi:MAG: MmgE/PrpD family protein, partial [Candidatus Binatia bacterium]
MAERNKNFDTFTKLMAEFAFDLTDESIPSDIKAVARRYLADTMACALGAHETDAARVVRKYATQKPSGADATILGTDRKVSAGLAALVNGTMVRYLDANDIFIMRRGGASGHCSDGTPGLLALAEQYRSSGEELLTCLVASYELQCALAETFRFRNHGLHALTHVAWVVPIVAARLIGATPAQAVHASGLAVATSTVLNTWLRPTHTIPMIKGVGVGLVLERVIESAELATLGVTATEDAFEAAFSGLSSTAASGVDPARIEKLGQQWNTNRNLIKVYPAQIYTQAAIEAALGLYQRGVRAEKIRRLTLYGNRNTCAGVQGSRQAFAPASREAADHSTPFVLAMSLLRGRLTSREYDEAPWETDEVKALMGIIELVDDPEKNRSLDAQGILGVRLVAELTDGVTEEINVHQPKGHPDASLSDAELLEKMTWLLDRIAPAHTPERLLDLCRRLSTVDDVKQLVDLCN